MVCVSLSPVEPGFVDVQVLLESFHDSADRVRINEDGTLRSKGFGFVEFTEHIHALAALRKLNNNPEYASYAIGGPAVGLCCVPLTLRALLCSALLSAVHCAPFQLVLLGKV